MMRFPIGWLRNSTVTVWPSLTWTVWEVSSSRKPSLALVSLMTSVVPGSTPSTRKVPVLSVTNLPLASPTTEPSDFVTRNSTSLKGLLSALDTFFTKMAPLGALEK